MAPAASTVVMSSFDVCVMNECGVKYGSLAGLAGPADGHLLTMLVIT